LSEIVVRSTRSGRIGDPLLAVDEERIAVDAGRYWS
jgi:hypothetical protein